jgi:hypothetical protein
MNLFHTFAAHCIYIFFVKLQDNNKIYAANCVASRFWMLFDISGECWQKCFVLNFRLSIEGLFTKNKFRNSYLCNM